MVGQDAVGTTTHGQKRRADDELRNEQRLAKRFDLLNLEQNGKLFVPVSAPLPTPPAALFSPPSDSMSVDDTPNRVFIHNLDAELRDIDNEEDTAIFLPDIEKKLAKIPKGVLTGEAYPSAHEKQLVLYRVPESLSLPKENDSVRKAIIDSRARARQSSATSGIDKFTPPATNIQSHVHQHARERLILDRHQDHHIVDEDAMDLG